MCSNEREREISFWDKAHIHNIYTRLFIYLYVYFFCATNYTGKRRRNSSLYFRMEKASVQQRKPHANSLVSAYSVARKSGKTSLWLCLLGGALAKCLLLWFPGPAGLPWAGGIAKEAPTYELLPSLFGASTQRFPLQSTRFYLFFTTKHGFAFLSSSPRLFFVKFQVIFAQPRIVMLHAPGKHHCC